MNPVMLIGLAAAVVLVLMLLRINAALVFLSVCLGDVLMQFVGQDTGSFAELFGRHANGSSHIMQFGLLLFPPIFTALFMIRTVRGGKLLFNLLPACGTGLLLAFLIVPLLVPATAAAITDSNLWHELQRSQDLIVGCSALVCLLSLWMQRPKSREEHAKH